MGQKRGAARRRAGERERMDREEAHQLFDERTRAAESVITVCHCFVKIFITLSLLWR